MSASPLANAVSALASTFAGQLLQPDDPSYDETRKLQNGLADKRPALIARCRGVADVVDAVKLAHNLKLEVAVRGGGHNVAGRASVDDGLMIDLSLMKGVHVDTKASKLRAEAGVTWGELNRESQLHRLATTGGVVSSTGVAGLTLGGGFGWLMSKYGLAADNLISADVVTADGRVLRASEQENPDLFWGIRGGGGNFGVTASFEFRLHPVGPTITGGVVAHPFAAAREVLRFYRDLTASLPDEMTAFAGLTHAPDGSGMKVALIAICHCGSLRDGEAAARPIKAFGSPVMDAMGPLPYCQQNTLMDAAYPKGAFNYWKSSFLDDLDDDAIDTMIEGFGACPSPMDHVMLEHFHGALTRVATDATAFPHRAPGYDILVISEWMDRALTDRCTAWARNTYSAMRPHMAAGRYVNYLSDDEPGDPAAEAYGANYRRLRELKTTYDPKNFFHMNQNIRPME
jgi:FAD/FMN-containing dehydrogenase